MGITIGKLIDPFYKEGILPEIHIFDNLPDLYYIDINTNRNEGIFSGGYKKEFNLLALHMLSGLGFINNFLSKLLPEDNLWLFRVRYISTYYYLLGIEKMQNYLFEKYGKENILAKECKFYLEKRPTLFHTEFRNCMMHYNLYHNEQCVIKDNCLNIKKPFFGLVESCYDGKDFFTLNNEIIELSRSMQEFLKKIVTIEPKKLKNL